MKHNGPTILIVDDEAAIRAYLRIALISEGYRTLEAENGHEAVALAKECQPDAVLLDMGLPDVSGLEVTRNLRSWGWIPIVFISVRDDQATKVEALDAGADDYVTKPFILEELMARLRAALRRKDVLPKSGTLECGGLFLDQSQRTASFNSMLLPLSPTEYLVLQTLMRHSGQLVPHRQILVEVWGPAYAEENHTLRVNIFNMRKKLEKAGARDYIVNEPGVGYRLAAPD